MDLRKFIFLVFLLLGNYTVNTVLPTKNETSETTVRFLSSIDLCNLFLSLTNH